MDRPDDYQTIIQLDLSNKYLTRVPEWIGDCVNLYWLWLNNNQLTELPANWILPETLEWLSLYNNKITNIPQNWKLPSNLKWLSISNNELTEFPDNIKLPSTLTILDLGFNKLTQLPSKLPNSLNELHISHNQLTELPQKWKPKNLDRFYTYNNNLPFKCIYDGNNLKEYKQYVFESKSATMIQRRWRRWYYTKDWLERNAMFEGMPPPRGLEWWGGGVLYQNAIEELD